MQNDKLQPYRQRTALAAEYHLGVPLKRHLYLFGSAMKMGCAVTYLILSLLVVLGAGERIMQHQRVIDWIVLLLGVLGFVGLVLLFLKALLTNRLVAYEWSEGFVVVSGRGQAEQVLMALRWDEITRAWKEEWRRLPSGRTPVRDTPVQYLIRDRHGRQYRLQHHAIWKRCQKELARRGLSKDRPVV